MNARLHLFALIVFAACLTTAAEGDDVTVNLADVVSELHDYTFNSAVGLDVFSNLSFNMPLPIGSGSSDLLTIDPASVSIPNAVPTMLISRQFQALLNGSPVQDATFGITSIQRGGAAASPINPPSIIGGNFSWLPHVNDFVTFGPNNWEFTIQASREELTAHATVTAQLTLFVPEPATMSLIGLFMASFIGGSRRFLVIRRFS